MNQPRITSGIAKNTKLKVPQAARPATERIKLSVFDTLAAAIEGAEVLDLFAGGGSFGLEALSRGASFCTFVERDTHATSLIHTNAAAASLSAQVKVYKKPVAEFIDKNRKQFDIIFLDPPFAAAAKFELRELKKLMHPNSITIFRTPLDTELPSYKTLPIIHLDKFGESKVHYIRLQPGGTQTNQSNSVH